MSNAVQYPASLKQKMTIFECQRCLMVLPLITLETDPSSKFRKDLSFENGKVRFVEEALFSFSFLALLLK
jgi:hypothetical protein